MVVEKLDDASLAFLSTAVAQQNLSPPMQKPKPIDMTKMDMSNPDSIMKMSKTGKPTMMFVSISGNPTEKVRYLL